MPNLVGVFVDTDGFELSDEDIRVIFQNISKGVNSSYLRLYKLLIMSEKFYSKHKDETGTFKYSFIRTTPEVSNEKVPIKKVKQKVAVNNQKSKGGRKHGRRSRKGHR